MPSVALPGTRCRSLPALRVSDAYGIDCEQCGLYHDDAELLDAVCTVCHEPTELRSLRRAFLELEPQRAWFEQYLGSITLCDPVREYAESVMSEALPSVAVTVLGGPGIPALDEELPGQTIYPAFELAPRYVVMTARHSAGSVYEPARTRTSMVFGVDNAFERVFLFPAVLRGLTETHAPFPDVMHLTYFYMLDGGAKFSTSRRHTVGVAELVGVAGADAARLYLAANRPERSPTNFTRSAFEGSAEVSAVRRCERGRIPARFHARRRTLPEIPASSSSTPPPNLPMRCSPSACPARTRRGRCSP